jgi:hypothetical protein
MSDGWYSGPVNGGGAPAAPAAPAAAGGAVPAAAGGAAAGPVTLAAEWDQKNLQGTVIKTTVLQYYVSPPCDPHVKMGVWESLLPLVAEWEQKI